MFAFTYAYLTLPFGTRIKMSSVDNGKWLIVRVNNHRPFVESRILDLCYEAAKKTGLVAVEIAKVKIGIVNL